MIQTRLLRLSLLPRLQWESCSRAFASQGSTLSSVGGSDRVVVLGEYQICIRC